MKRLALLLIVSLWIDQITLAQRVALPTTDLSSQMSYAVGVLKKALLKKGCSVVETGADFRITMSIDTGRLSSEAYSIRRQGKAVMLKGGDERGLIYGSFWT